MKTQILFDQFLFFSEYTSTPHKEHFTEDVPNGSFSVATKNGLINSDIFFNVLKHIQKNTSCTKDNSILLLCDNYESHVFVEAINYVQKIEFLLKILIFNIQSYVN